LESLQEEQRQEFCRFTSELYDRIMNGKALVEVVEPIQSPPEIQEKIEEQPKEQETLPISANVHALMEMGFDRRMASGALEVGKDNM
jgi:hypothetical protein